MKPVFIYALLDPRTGETRYAGQTSRPDRRLWEHINEAKKKKFHNACWIRSLLALGLLPIMEILDVVPDNEADFWETEHIQNFRERGFQLTNFSDGGGTGMRGKKHSPEACARMGASHVGYKHSAETREKMSAALTGNNRWLGKKHSAETRAKMRTSNTRALLGKKLSPETRSKMSAASLGKPKSPEHNAKVSAALKGRKFSAEHRANLSAAHLGKGKEKCLS